VATSCHELPTASCGCDDVHSTYSQHTHTPDTQLTDDYSCAEASCDPKLPPVPTGTSWCEGGRQQCRTLALFSDHDSPRGLELVGPSDAGPQPPSLHADTFIVVTEQGKGRTTIGLSHCHQHHWLPRCGQSRHTPPLAVDASAVKRCVKPARTCSNNCICVSWVRTRMHMHGSQGTPAYACTPLSNYTCNHMGPAGSHTGQERISQCSRGVRHGPRQCPQHAPPNEAPEPSRAADSCPCLSALAEAQYGASFAC